MPKIGFKQLLLFMGALGIAYVFLFLFNSQTDETDVSNLEPYAELMNQTVKLNEEVVVFVNQKELRRAADYLMLVKTSVSSTRKEKLYTLPVGHELKLTKAIHFTSGTSGFSVPYVIGECFIPELNETIYFEYAWGNEVTSMLQEAPLRFTYDKAPWQKKALSGFYTF